VDVWFVPLLMEALSGGTIFDRCSQFFELACPPLPQWCSKLETLCRIGFSANNRQENCTEAQVKLTVLPYFSIT